MNQEKYAFMDGGGVIEDGDYEELLDKYVRISELGESVWDVLGVEAIGDIYFVKIEGAIH